MMACGGIRSASSGAATRAGEPQNGQVLDVCAGRQHGAPPALLAGELAIGHGPILALARGQAEFEHHLGAGSGAGLHRLLEAAAIALQVLVGWIEAQVAAALGTIEGLRGAGRLGLGRRLRHQGPAFRNQILRFDFTGDKAEALQGGGVGWVGSQRPLEVLFLLDQVVGCGGQPQPGIGVVAVVFGGLQQQLPGALALAGLQRRAPVAHQVFGRVAAVVAVVIVAHGWAASCRACSRSSGVLTLKKLRWRGSKRSISTSST